MMGTWVNLSPSVLCGLASCKSLRSWMPLFCLRPMLPCNPLRTFCSLLAQRNREESLALWNGKHPTQQALHRKPKTGALSWVRETVYFIHCSVSAGSDLESLITPGHKACVSSSGPTLSFLAEGIKGGVGQDGALLQGVLSNCFLSLSLPGLPGLSLGAGVIEPKVHLKLS